MTTEGTIVAADGRTLSVRVPLTVRKRGGRKRVVAPDGASRAASRVQIDNTLIKALARAHRWKRMLEGGLYASVSDLAKAESIHESYLCRVLRLTLLSPVIVDAILDGRQGPELTLTRLLAPFPVDWSAQQNFQKQVISFKNDNRKSLPR